MTKTLDYIKDINRETLDSANSTHYMKGVQRGLSKELVEKISRDKKEPKWMLEHRLKSLDVFFQKPMPGFGPDLSGLNLEDIIYYAAPGEVTNAHSWDQVPDDIKRTFEKLGIPEAERKYLAGAGAQYESKNVYHKLKEKWSSKGVIFEDMDSALQLYPDLVRQYFMKCVPMFDHKFAALHGAVWSGGTFIYLPAGVDVNQPLQAYFRMNASSMGQFEHTLIIVEKGAFGSYLEGCSAPKYENPSIHAGLVEVFVKEGARFRYSSVENWSRNTYNLNTKRAIVEKNGIMEWVGGNMGCLTGDALVATNPRGPVQINKLSAGDNVFAYDEKSRSIKKAKVKNIIYSGEKEVFKIRAGGREMEASGNHPFLTVERKIIPSNKRKGKFVTMWKSLENLKKGDPIAINKMLPDFGKPFILPSMKDYKNKTTVSHNQYTVRPFKLSLQHLFNDYSFPKITNKDFMWFLGIVIGDGHIWMPEKQGAKINIAIHEKTDLRKPVLQVIKKLFSYKVTYMQDRFIIINSRPIAEFLSKIGFGGTASTKKIPAWVHSLPRSQKLAFLGGYFDSDGHTGQNGVYITSINKGLLESVKELAISCGIGCSTIFSHGRLHRTKILGKDCIARNSYRILLNGARVVEIGTRSDSAKSDLLKIKTQRNYSTKKGWNFRSLVNDEIGFAKIDEITFEGIKPTYDIEVEKYHNFIANGMIVHNSGVTMLYPCSILKGEGAHADHLGIAFANRDQIQDTGAKVIHVAPNTTSKVVMKSLSKNGGKSVYRGLLNILKGAKGSKAQVKCDALILDDHSVSDTVPDMKIAENDVSIGHEATVGKISDEQMFYCMSRGLSEDEATALIVNGFIEPIVKAMPLEYAVEMNRLIELEMEAAGAVG